MNFWHLLCLGIILLSSFDATTQKSTGQKKMRGKLRPMVGGANATEAEDTPAAGAANSTDAAAAETELPTEAEGTEVDEAAAAGNASESAVEMEGSEAEAGAADPELQTDIADEKEGLKVAKVVISKLKSLNKWLAGVVGHWDAIASGAGGVPGGEAKAAGGAEAANATEAAGEEAGAAEGEAAEGGNATDAKGAPAAGAAFLAPDPAKEEAYNNDYQYGADAEAAHDEMEDDKEAIYGDYVRENGMQDYAEDGDYPANGDDDQPQDGQPPMSGDRVEDAEMAYDDDSYPGGGEAEPAAEQVVEEYEEQVYGDDEGGAMPQAERVMEQMHEDYLHHLFSMEN